MKKKLLFWLQALAALLLVLLAGHFYPSLRMDAYADFNAARELYFSLQFTNLLLVGCTAVILYGLKFRK